MRFHYLVRQHVDCASSLVLFNANLSAIHHLSFSRAPYLPNFIVFVYLMSISSGLEYCMPHELPLNYQTVD